MLGTTFILCDLSSHVRFDDAAYTIFSLRLFASVWLCEDAQELKAAGDDGAVATRERRAAVGRMVAPHCSVARSRHLWTMVLKACSMCSGSIAITVLHATKAELQSASPV